MESRIVWLEDITTITYVRQFEAVLPRRVGRPGRKQYWFSDLDRLVGYSEVTSDTQRGHFDGGFRRRVFWLKTYDVDGCGKGYQNGQLIYRPGSDVWPSEAVDPRNVIAGEKSR